MKKKKSAVRMILAVLIVILFFAVTIVIVRPDFQGLVGQFTAITRRNVEMPLKEIPSDPLDLIRVNKDELDIGTELMLVNKDHPLNDSFTPSVCEYKESGVMMSTASVDSYGALSKSVTDNCSELLYVMSSYRTGEEQQEIYSEQGSSEAMPPRCSEHETGLAQDLYFEGYAGKSINKCAAGRYLTEHAPEYGFIVRYPSYGKKVTGIKYEPWHFRYVGLPHAKIITDYSLTLEEYIEGMEYGCFYEYEDNIISRQCGDELLIPRNCTCDISFDNCGGYIITAKKK